MALSLRLALFISFRPAGQLFNSPFQVALVISRIGMSNPLGFSLLESGASAPRCARCDTFLCFTAFPYWAHWVGVWRQTC